MKEVGVLTVALLLLAAGAAWSSFRGEVVVQPLSPMVTMVPDRVDRFEYLSSTSTVVAVRREDHWWIDVRRKATDRGFVASDAFDTSLDALLPLRPLRSLGEMDEERVAAFELEPPKIVLVFDGPGGQQKVEVGDRTQVGQKDGYARSPGGEEVFIVDLSEIDRFDNAYAFRRRSLRAQDREEVAAVVLSWSKGEVRARQRNRRQPRERFWASASAPEERDEQLDALLDEIERLRIQKYPDPAPNLSDEEALLTVKWLDAEDEALDTMRLWRTSEDDRETWFVRSNSTHRPGEIVRAAGRKLVVALEALPAPQ